ncbi:Protein tas [Porphyridium purpureum]|uniref:Protein tas n=1 Tax=Porphyridium purpureum TaxID=35688 RepID=A0A5J4YWH1_PORPP|nr:Protein tas [Porphyridium purpureum]|eukprot:POR2329..scf209_3
MVWRTTMAFGFALSLSGARAQKHHAGSCCLNARSGNEARVKMNAPANVDAAASAVPGVVKKKGYDLRFRKLGDSDLVVPEVCLGTMTFGKQNTEQEGFSQMDCALDAGVNFLDTAEMYPVPVNDGSLWGNTESIVGKWLRTQKREDVIIATKVAGAGRNMEYVRGGPRVNREQIRQAVHDSLKRLQTDYVDLIQIHWPDRYVPLFGMRAYDPQFERDAVPIVEQLRAFKELVDEGKVRYLGVSNETAFGVCEFCRLAELDPSLPKIVSIQNSYSLLHRDFESHIAEACTPCNYNVGLLTYSPLAGGALTGKYQRGQSAPAESRFTLFPNYMKRFQESLTLEAVEKYVGVAQKHGMSPTRLALGFARAQWFNTSTIIGATSMEQLRENLDAFNFDLSPEVMQDIDSVFKRYRQTTSEDESPLDRQHVWDHDP